MVYKNKAERFSELEGLRGIAAVMVAFYHYLIAFYAFAFFGAGTANATIANNPFETFIHGSPVMGLVSGTFAVAIFFVLSGFVLSIGYFQTGKQSIIRSLAAKRYLRLMLPALISVLLCYVLIKAHLSHTQQAAALTHSGWLSFQWNFVPSLHEAISNATWGIFTKEGSVYNNVLWTMMTEFMGSFLVFGVLLIFGQSKNRAILYTTLLVITFNTWFMGFILGMIIADLYSRRVLRRRTRRAFYIVGLLAVGIFLGGYPYSGVEGTVYQALTPTSLVGKVNFLSVYTLIGATLVVGVVVTAAQAARVLAKKYISILGRYTFSLYLVHVPILFTFTTFCFTHLIHHMGYNLAAVLSILLSVPVVAIATVLFERYVDQPAIKLAGIIAAIYMGDRRLALQVDLKRYIDFVKKKLRPQAAVMPVIEQDLAD